MHPGLIQDIMHGWAGAAIAVEASDVALFTNDLRALAPIVRLARRARRKIAENITVAVVTKVRSPLPPGQPDLASSLDVPGRHAQRHYCSTVLRMSGDRLQESSCIAMWHAVHLSVKK